MNKSLSVPGPLKCAEESRRPYMRHSGEKRPGKDMIEFFIYAPKFKAMKGEVYSDADLVCGGHLHRLKKFVKGSRLKNIISV